MSAVPRIFDLRLTLCDVDTPVWRLLRVSSGATLPRAQRLICVCFGWPGGKPYTFTTDGLQYPSDGKTDQRTDVRLRQLLPDIGSELEFDYGNGASWTVEARVERILPDSDTLVTPCCLDGGGESPPLGAGGAFAWNDRAPAAAGERRPATVGFPRDAINAELERLR